MPGLGKVMLFQTTFMKELISVASPLSLYLAKNLSGFEVSETSGNFAF